MVTRTKKPLDEARSALQEAISRANQLYTDLDLTGVGHVHQEEPWYCVCPDCDGHGGEDCYCGGSGRDPECMGKDPYLKIITLCEEVSTEARQLKDHAHQWNGDDYCDLCGRDGRA